MRLKSLELLQSFLNFFNLFLGAPAISVVDGILESEFVEVVENGFFLANIQS
jgi:hypothetical protein